jgi:hypothetical protein
MSLDNAGSMKGNEWGARMTAGLPGPGAGSILTIGPCRIRDGAAGHRTKEKGGLKAAL